MIREGLLMREQMAYMAKLRSRGVEPSEGLALLELAPAVKPAPDDRMPRRRGPRRTR